MSVKSWGSVLITVGN